MSSYFFLLFAFSFGALEAGVIAKNQERIEKTYVESFIKFKSVQEPGEAFPTIKPIGCSPTNNDTDKYIVANQTVMFHDFYFACIQDEYGDFHFEAVRCIDPLGEMMEINEKRLVSNGTVLLECRIEGSTLKKVYERASGCRHNGSVYMAEETWVENDVVKQCFNVRLSYHEVHTIGCSVNSTIVLFGEVTTLENGTSFRCLEDGYEQVKLERVTQEDFKCVRGDGQKVAHNSTFQEDDGAYKCSFGKLEKTGCVINGEILPTGRIAKLSNECVAACAQETAIVCMKIESDVKIVEVLDRRLPEVAMKDLPLVVGGVISSRK